MFRGGAECIIEGVYNLIDGELSSGGVYYNEITQSGMFNQSGGIHQNSSGLKIGETVGDSATYNLSGGIFMTDAIVINGKMNYSGGELHLSDGEISNQTCPDCQSGTLINNGITNLSGNGTRVIDGNVINNGTFEVQGTKARVDGNFENNGSFLGDSSVVHFTDLTLGDGGTMEGSGQDSWFIRGGLSGISFDPENVVLNMKGASCFSVYYNSSFSENDYLGGLTYDLFGGGHLAPFDAFVSSEENYSMTLILGEQIWFDYWFDTLAEEGSYEQGFNFDVLMLQENETESWWVEFGRVDAYYSSTGWEFAMLDVPEELWGMETQIRFIIDDYYPETDPIVYLNNIRTSVPEPSTILFFALGLVGLVGMNRKVKKLNSI